MLIEYYRKKKGSSKSLEWVLNEPKESDLTVISKLLETTPNISEKQDQALKHLNRFKMNHQILE